MAKKSEDSTQEKQPISVFTGLPCTDEELSALRDIEIVAELEPWGHGISLYLRGSVPALDPTPSGYRKYVVTGLKVSEIESVVSYNAAQPIRIGNEGAVILMDQLWKLGVRPSDANLPTPPTLEATKRHLEDMRRLVFDEWLAEDETDED